MSKAKLYSKPFSQPAGLLRAVETESIYVVDCFDKKEYFYYDDPANGDLHEVVPGKVCLNPKS